MTVSTTSSSIGYTGTPATNEFPIPFLFRDDGDVVATLRPPGGTLRTLVFGVDYTLSGAGDSTGGTLTILSDTAQTDLDNGGALSIARSTPLLQTVAFRTQGTFSPALHERALDVLTMQVQELAQRLEDAFDNDIIQTVIATGSISGRSLEDRFADVLNVRDFGALGNGAHNDTLAIQAALTAASVSGAPVFLPSGTYLLDAWNAAASNMIGATVVPTGVTLFGQGYSSCLKLRPASITGDGFWRMLAFRSNSQLRDFRVDGNKAALVGLVDSDFVGLMGHLTDSAVTGFLIDNVEVHDIASSGSGGSGNESFGIATSKTSTDGRIRDCKVARVEGSGIHVTGDIGGITGTPTDWKTPESTVQRVDVIDCEVRDCTWQGVSLYGVKNCRVLGGRFKGCKQGLNSEWCVDVEFNGAVSHGNSRAGISLFGRTNVRIVNCELFDNNTAAFTSGGEIRVLGSPWKTGSPIPNGIAESVYVSGCKVRPATGTAHLMVQRYSTANIGGSVPDSIILDQPDAASWVVSNLSVNPDQFAAVHLQGLVRNAVVRLQAVGDWTPDAGMTVAAYAGAGNFNANATTLTCSAANKRIISKQLLRRGRTYVLRARYRVEDVVGQWALRAEDSAGSNRSSSLRIQPYAPAGGSTDVGQWWESEWVYTVPTGAASEARVIAIRTDAVASASSLTLDYVNAYEVPGSQVQSDVAPLRARSAFTTWAPAVANGAQLTTTVTVTGAVLGDTAIASLGVDLQGMQLTAYVSAADTVTVVLQNGTGGNLTLASSTLRVDAFVQ